MQTPKITDLPLELRQTILSNLPESSLRKERWPLLTPSAKDDIRNARLACKGLYDASWEAFGDLIAEKKFFLYEASVATLSELTKIPELAPWIRTLSLCGVTLGYHMPPSIFSKNRSKPFLQLEEKGFEEYKRQEEFRMSGRYRKQMLAIFQSLPNLRHIRFFAERQTEAEHLQDMERWYGPLNEQIKEFWCMWMFSGNEDWRGAVHYRGGLSVGGGFSMGSIETSPSQRLAQELFGAMAASKLNIQSLDFPLRRGRGLMANHSLMVFDYIPRHIVENSLRHLTRCSLTLLLWEHATNAGCLTRLLSVAPKLRFLDVYFEEPEWAQHGVLNNANPPFSLPELQELRLFFYDDFLGGGASEEDLMHFLAPFRASLRKLVLARCHILYHGSWTSAFHRLSRDFDLDELWFMNDTQSVWDVPDLKHAARAVYIKEVPEPQLLPPHLDTRSWRRDHMYLDPQGQDYTRL